MGAPGAVRHPHPPASAEAWDPPAPEPSVVAEVPSEVLAPPADALLVAAAVELAAAVCEAPSPVVELVVAAASVADVVLDVTLEVLLALEVLLPCVVAPLAVGVVPPAEVAVPAVAPPAPVTLETALASSHCSTSGSIAPVWSSPRKGTTYSASNKASEGP